MMLKQPSAKRLGMGGLTHGAHSGALEINTSRSAKTQKAFGVLHHFYPPTSVLGCIQRTPVAPPSLGSEGSPWGLEGRRSRRER